jgi:hypothetical protein
MILIHPFCCKCFDKIGLEDDNDSSGRKAAVDLLPDYQFRVHLSKIAQMFSILFHKELYLQVSNKAI